jgi:hypothetical protein
MPQVFVHTLLIPCLLALPTYAATPELEPPYQPEPNRRGTISLIFGCAAMLFLSVVTALHLNVDPSRRPAQRAARKLRWVISAIIFPEYLVCIALVEWGVMRRICKEGRSIFLPVTLLDF